MPLDSINPLMSATGTLGPAWWLPPVPGGVVTAADRKQLSGTYAGFAADQDVAGGTLLAVGDGIAAFAGTASYVASLASIGGGAAAFDGQYAAAGVNTLLVNGSGLAAFDGTASYTASLAVVGSSTAVFDGTASYNGSLASIGSGLAVFDGQYAAAGVNTLSVVGTSVAVFAGVASYNASFASAGSGLAVFAGTGPPSEASEYLLLCVTPGSILFVWRSS